MARGGQWAAGAFATRGMIQAAASELREQGVHVPLLIVDATIEELGVTEPSAIGQVMGAIMKQHDGLDGTVVNKLVRARLAG